MSALDEMKSEQIGELAKALCAVQSEIQGAVKDHANPFFKSKYADLESVWNAARGPLTKNGLAVSQTTDVDDQGRMTLLTWLIHSSGQWICGKLSILAQKPDAQSAGAAITYARRFALAAIVGIHQTDDDGESAVGRGKPNIPVHTTNQTPHSNGIDNINDAFDQAMSTPQKDPELALMSASPRWEAHKASAMREPGDETPDDSSRLGDYVVTFGKFADRKLKQVKPEELGAYIKWLQDNAVKTHKPIAGKAREFVDTAHAYLAAL